jgi:hypothetical protein
MAMSAAIEKAQNYLIEVGAAVFVCYELKQS